MINEITEQVLQGVKDPLQAYADLKLLQKEIAEALKTIEADAINEAKKYGKTFNLYGFKFTHRSGAVRYDYKHIKQWQEVENYKKFIEEQSKAALKALEQGGTVVDQDGQIVEPPKVSYSKDSLSVQYG